MEHEVNDNSGTREETPEYGFWADATSSKEDNTNEQSSSMYRMTRDDLINNMGSGASGGAARPPKKKHRGLRYAALVLLLGIVAGGTLFISSKLFGESVTDKSNGTLFGDNKPAAVTETPRPSSEPVTPGKGTDQIGNTKVVQDTLNSDNVVIDVAKNTMSSIVSITSTIEAQDYFGQTAEQQGSGSGIIIKKTADSLLLVTNNHVVSGAKSIQVTFVDGKNVKATVKGTDSSADLAIVTVKLSDMKESTVKKINAVTLGNSDDVKVGELAIAIGNALGYGQSVTVGYVSAKDRQMSSTSTSSQSASNSLTLIQTDAAINPGNSGGALLNAKGELIGINSAKFASKDVEGMGYAIPISKALPIIDELMKRETLKDSEKGYLGISGSNVSEAENKTYSIPMGVVVSEVSEDGAAKDAGIKVRDIITKINGIEVTDISALAERVNAYRVGTTVTLTVARQSEGGYKTMEIKVKLKGAKTLESIDNSGKQEQQKSSGSNNGNSNGNSNGGNDFNFWDFFQ